MLKLVKRKTSKQHVSIKEFYIHGHENKNKLSISRAAVFVNARRISAFKK